MGAAVSIHISARHAQGIHRALPQALIEIAVGVFLDRESLVIEEREVLYEFRRFIEIKQNADPATMCRRKNRAEKPDQIKRCELALLRMQQDVIAQVVGESRFKNVGHEAQANLNH